MKCHYEILNIERDADDGQIKTAYRKQALKWHPDKNLDNSELAKDQFQLVQQAYEVLSDPQERAWYDNHREQILRGGHSDYEDNALDIFPYFTVSCFKGYNDSPEGFYAVYGEVFEKLASEDIEYMDSPEDYESIPKFGNSKSNYEEEVRPFYAYWESYCTKKSYAWKCTYNIAEIRDRRVLKEIEKENKKVQQKHKKERNDEIRSLVSFVRKRDKRVMEYKKLLEEKALQNRLKSERIQLEQYIKRSAEIKEQQQNSSSILNEGYEEQLRKLEAEYNTDSDSEDDYTDEEEDLVEGNEINVDDLIDIQNLDVADDNNVEENDIYDDPLYCIACNKNFKTESSYKNHESSKKHRDNVGQLRAELLEDENIHISDIDENSLEESTTTKVKKNKKSSRMKKKVQISDEEEAVTSDKDAEDEISTEKELNIITNNEDDNNWDQNSNNKKKKKPKNSKSSARSATAPEATDSASVEKPCKTVNSESRQTKSAGRVKERKIGGDRSEKIGDADIDHVCVTCKAEFDSKNKLFNHLKKMNHGVYIPKPKTGERGSGSGRKK